MQIYGACIGEKYGADQLVATEVIMCIASEKNENNFFY
jgi:hypothetical protein